MKTAWSANGGGTMTIGVRMYLPCWSVVLPQILACTIVRLDRIHTVIGKSINFCFLFGVGSGCVCVFFRPCPQRMSLGMEDISAFVTRTEVSRMSTDFFSWPV